jgi:hypothetical protein
VRDFGDLQFKPGEYVEDFALHITTLRNQLCALSDKVNEKEEIKKLLHSVPEHLKQVAISIETLLDLNSMTIEEAIGHLRAVEGRKKKTSNQAKDGRLLLTEEEWLAHLKVHEGEWSSDGRGSRGRERGDSDRSLHGESQEEGVRRPKATDVCQAYGKLGHWAKKMGQTHLGEEEEGRLMLVKTSEFRADARLTKFKYLPSPSATILSPAISPSPRDFVHLIEEKVIAQLGQEEEGRSTAKRVVNTGTTNHMTGARTAFIELNINVWGTIRFGDGSMVRIEGCDTIIFSYKNDEHRVFIGIYYIPKLKANIISVGQLDEAGYDVHISSSTM